MLYTFLGYIFFIKHCSIIFYDQAAWEVNIVTRVSPLDSSILLINLLSKTSINSKSKSLTLQNADINYAQSIGFNYSIAVYLPFSSSNLSLRTTFLIILNTVVFYISRSARELLITASDYNL